MEVRAPPLLRGTYRPIGDYGAIGDGRSVALLSQDGSLDWWCPGRFDAPSVFGAILDGQQGGSFRIGLAGEGTSASRYVDDTNVLETLHRAPTGVVRVVDFAPLPRDTGLEDAVLIRRVTGVEGVVDLRVRFAPRFHYGRVAPRFSLGPAGIMARGAGEMLLLQAPALALDAREGAWETVLRVEAGQQVDFVLRHVPFDAPMPFEDTLAVSPADLETRSVAHWRAWAGRIRYDGRDAAQVRRAALALKLLQHDNGAIIAAPTTSLPEAIGGVRNWDYRYTWIRDAVLTARALMLIGHDDEASRLAGWIGRTLGERPEEMRIMYTLSGSSELPERELEHLEGYHGSVPVRIGNGAVLQRQLDVYGELLDFLHAAPGAAPAHWDLCRRLADHVADTWRLPDSGIWEMRCEPRHFVFSKAMAWVALDRASRLAREHRLAGDVARWEHEAALVRAEVLEKGWDPALNAFTQAYGFPLLDASNLLLPLIGFIDAKDPRMVATVDRTLEQLTVNGLVYRYLDAGDGLPGGEATFAYCTFWLIEVLAKQGRVEEARTLFDRMLARANHLGLYAEEIDPATAAHLGNFPQGFPHAGLIQAALALQEAERAAAADDVRTVTVDSGSAPTGSDLAAAPAIGAPAEP